MHREVPEARSTLAGRGGLMARLPHAAVRLLRRSRQLTLGQKAIWQELAEFPETGCWLSADALGDRLALSGPKVEQYRRLLKACGLARLGQRQPSEGRSGRPAQTWFAAMPDHLVPSSRTPTDKDLRGLGARLDAHIVECLGRMKSAPPDTEPDDEVSDPVGSETNRPRRVGNLHPEARSASRGEGGRGEGSPSSQPVVSTTVSPLSHSPNRDLNSARETPAPRSMLVPTRSRPLVRAGTAEFDRTIEGEVGGRRAPADLQHQLDGWLQRVAGGSR